MSSETTITFEEAAHGYSYLANHLPNENCYLRNLCNQAALKFREGITPKDLILEIYQGLKAKGYV